MHSFKSNLFLKKKSKYFWRLGFPFQGVQYCCFLAVNIHRRQTGSHHESSCSVIRLEKMLAGNLYINLLVLLLIIIAKYLQKSVVLITDDEYYKQYICVPLSKKKTKQTDPKFHNIFLSHLFFLQNEEIHLSNYLGRNFTCRPGPMNDRLLCGFSGYDRICFNTLQLNQNS